MEKIVRCIYGGMVILIMTVCLLGTHLNFAYKKIMEYKNWQYWMLGMFVIFIFSILIRLMERLAVRVPERIRQIVSRNMKWWMLGMNVLFFLGLVFCSYHYYFITGWDAQRIEGASRLIAVGLYEEAQTKYFSYYPNNILLTFLFSLVVRFGYAIGISNYYYGIICFQCFLFAAAGYLLYCTAERLINKVWALGIWTLFVCFIGISPWVVIPYSDGTGIAFPIFIFYMYLCIKDQKSVRIHWVLLTLVSYIGYCIKPQILIMLIGIVLVSFVDFWKATSEMRKKRIKNIVWPIFGLLLGIVFVNVSVKATRMEIDEEFAFSVPHFLMMGMNDEAGGVINLEDQNLSMSIQKAEERNRVNLEIAVTRIKEMGGAGLGKLAVKKILTNYSDGTFAWWEEGEFYTQEMYDGNYVLRSILTNFYYKHGSHFQTFVNYMQTMWMGVLFFSGIVCLGRKNDERNSVLMLAMIGLFLFETIFEARARYLFAYTPIYVLLAGMGMNRMILFVEAKKALRKGQ